MTILVIAEHNNAALNAATLNTVAAAQAIGGDIEVLVAGAGCGAVAEAAAKIAGVSMVLMAGHAAYAYLPRVAALLDVDQISEIISVESPDTFKRPIYAGNAIATVKSDAAVKVITVRATGFDAVAAEGGSAAIEAVASAQDAGISAFVG